MKIYIGCKDFADFQNFAMSQWYKSGNVYVYNHLLFRDLHLIVALKSTQGKIIKKMIDDKVDVQQLYDYMTTCLLQNIAPAQMRELIQTHQETEYTRGKQDKTNQLRELLGVDAFSLARERAELKRSGHTFM